MQGSCLQGLLMGGPLGPVFDVLREVAGREVMFLRKENE